MLSCLLYFRLLIWRQLEPSDPKLSSHFPVAYFFNDTLIADILDNFLTLTSKDKVAFMGICGDRSRRSFGDCFQRQRRGE